MNSPSSIPDRGCEDLRLWLVTRALPLWAEQGWDRGASLFVERLTLAGAPVLDAPRRAMVQARQIFVFSVVAQRRWSSVFDARLLEATDSLVRRFHAVDGAPGWIFSVHRSGEPADHRRDLYAHAFILLALAHAGRTTGERRFLALADETLDFLDRVMRGPSGGYLDAVPPPPDGSLRQNPHMHLFEAMLALHEAAPEGGYLKRAGALAELMLERFVRGGVLIEHFESDWTPRGGPDYPFEPGHHFEWAWLLARFAQLAGRPVPQAASALRHNAMIFGLAPDGTICDETSLSRGPLKRSTRLWPYAEAAKAAHCGFSTPGAMPSPGDFLAALQNRFLTPAFPGSWIDHFDERGKPKIDFAPASSLYHITCALDEVMAPGDETQGPHDNKCFV